MHGVAIPAENAEACCGICVSASILCVGYTFMKVDKGCWLKNAVGPLRADSRAISGSVIRDATQEGPRVTCLGGCGKVADPLNTEPQDSLARRSRTQALRNVGLSEEDQYILEFPPWKEQQLMASAWGWDEDGVIVEVERKCATWIPMNHEKDAPLLPLFLGVFNLYHALWVESLFGPGVSKLDGWMQLVMMQEELGKKLCPPALGIAMLFRAERMLLSVLPLASSETPSGMVAPVILETRETLDNLDDITALAPQEDVAALRLLDGARLRVEALLTTVTAGMREMWFGERRSWVLDPWLWGAFNRFGRITLSPVGPTPWDFDVAFGLSRRSLRGSSAKSVERGWRDVEEAMAEAAAGAEWWPAMGTLIGFLRYGRLHGELSNGKVDFVDDDIDIIAVFPSAHAWFTFVLIFTRLLIQHEWFGCAHALQGRYHNETQRLERDGIILRGESVLICNKMTPTGDVVLNVFWALPVVEETRPSRDTPFQCPVPKSLSPQIAKIQCGARVRVAAEAGKGERFAISEEVLCIPGGPCWSTSTFFRHWPGAVGPVRLRWPMVRCEAWGFPVACPAGSLDITQHWRATSIGGSGGEYWRPAAGATRWSCLALPDIACPDPSAQDAASWREDRRPDDARNARMHAEGLTREDIAILRMHQRRLLAGGYLAHNFSGCDWSRCDRSREASSGDVSWGETPEVMASKHWTTRGE